MSKALNVAMIVIGDEILNGRTTDANGVWLSKYLFKKGLELSSISFIRDQKSEMNEALKRALETADIVITSGGIGPTLDDKTKNTFAEFFGKKLVVRDDVAQIVTDNYIRFGRTWNPGMNHYHHFPEDFIPVANPKGLAPGLAFYEENTKKLLLSGPGVPREFFEMTDKGFLPLIEKFFQGRFKTNYQTVIRTQGVPEEKIFFELCPTLWSDLEKYGKVSSLPHTIGIDIIVSYHGTENDHEQNQKNIRSLINSTKLAEHVWQWGNKPLNEMVLELGIQKQKTISFAESCTGGLCASKMTDLPGSSKVFWGGVVSYDNSVKINQLGVQKKTLDQFGAVSIEVAKEMAEGCRKICGTDFAVSVSGIAGPDGGTPQKPVGTVAIGYASATKSGAALFQFPGDRIRLKERFSDKALLTLLELMRE